MQNITFFFACHNLNSMLKLLRGEFSVFYLLSEPGYATSNWYRHIIDGILVEKRAKRFNIVMLDSIDEIENFPIVNDDAVLLVGSGSIWLESILDICKQRFGKNIIVLGNFEHHVNGKTYSIVSSDISADIFCLYAYLLSYKKSRIAMYAVNPNSASDSYRKNCFLKCGGKDKDIYFNNADLYMCYKTFIKNIENYDAVICVNDYTAISLVRHLNTDNIKIPFIVSCGETKLAKVFTPSITNLRTSYKDFGKAAINIHKILQKDLPISYLKIELASSIVPGDTTDNLPTQPSAITELMPKAIEKDDSFYLDSEVSEMLKIEKMLNRCDKTEFDILLSLIEGKTYFELSEQYHMSVNGIKYKLNKLFELCDVTSKAQFLELIKKYI